jgi:hypothetical protein
MPKKYGIDIPGTLERSSTKAQRTYAKTKAAAEQQYGPGERASRIAYASLKHGFEKVGDRWVEKDRKGPSDPQAAKSGKAAREGRSESRGGVDEFGRTRKELYERARRLGVPGRSSMNKDELARAIARKQR